MRDFSKTFRKNVFYDNIKSHQKSGLHPVYRKNNFGRKHWDRWGHSGTRKSDWIR